MSWNDERVELLKKLWAEGLSASQIAGRIGSVTRNAVIGKVHRLGLSGRATTTRMKSHRPRTRANPVKRPAGPPAKPRFANVGNTALRALYQAETEPYVAPAEEIVIPLAERRSIQTLEESHCRWPIGDPQEEEFHFCGKSKVTGLPYCDFHARRAFQPPQARRQPGSPPARYAVTAAPKQETASKSETETVEPVDA
ncbi:MAG: GcrA family cell cycle regulator [Hyphomicrobiaceae bacterium]|nr:GcrA family cell cycle regulator [Hyphomicrobiaceae bacterium]